MKNEPEWPRDEGPYLVMLEVSGPMERRILDSWIKRHRPGEARKGDVQIALLPTTRRRRRRSGRRDPRLGAFLDTEADPLLIPLRVAWLPSKKKGGIRVARLRELLSLGDPRDPNALMQVYRYWSHPERVRILTGVATHASVLRNGWEKAPTGGRDDGTALASYVASKAWLDLERSERNLRGSRYKVAKFVRDDIIASNQFTKGVAELARDADVSYEQMAHRTGHYVREIASSHRWWTIDIVASAIKWLVGKAYVDIDYDHAELAALYDMSESVPLVFLPSHKSNFDHLTLQYVFYENGLPQTHTAAGINMNFFPIGPFLRRTGAFFIRRDFKTNEPYKFALRRYLDYLLSRRFSLEWYIEGGRSRTGKLRSPRFGMLAYVVEAYERGASDDVVFIPVSIAYDQIQDVRAHVAEASGKGKQNEGARWLFRQLSKDLTDSYGKIYVRFGAPIRLGEFLTTVGESEDADDPRSTVVPKLAFEVSTRINEVTPITPISLVTMVLLGQGGSAMTFADIQSALRPIAAFIDRRSFPTTEPINFDTEDQIRASLNQLITHKVVEEFPGVDEPIFSIAHEQHLAASYYRNTIIHFFVTTAITELAILNVRDDPDAAHSVFDKALELRDLLKFEFFFPATDAFLGDVRHELLRHNSEWRSLLVAGDIDTLLSDFDPVLAPLALRPFIESYRVIADVIERNAYVSTLDEKTVKKDAMSLGGQYLRQGDIASPESVSNPLFDTAIELTKYLGLLDPCATSIRDREAHAARLRLLVEQLTQLANRPV